MNLFRIEVEEHPNKHGTMVIFNIGIAIARVEIFVEVCALLSGSGT